MFRDSFKYSSNKEAVLSDLIDSEFQVQMNSKEIKLIPLFYLFDFNKRPPFKPRVFLCFDELNKSIFVNARMSYFEMFFHLLINSILISFIIFMLNNESEYLIIKKMKEDYLGFIGTLFLYNVLNFSFFYGYCIKSVKQIKRIANPR